MQSSIQYPTDLVRQPYSDLEALIDRVHTLFDHWEKSGVLQPQIDADTLNRTKLAVHEWLANLIQHANFQGSEPEVWIDIRPNATRVYCVVEDNSAGFDLAQNLDLREALLESFPERGMGLLMLQACTQDLSYRLCDTGRYRLQFSVSADQDPWLNIPF